MSGYPASHLYPRPSFTASSGNAPYNPFNQASSTPSGYHSSQNVMPPMFSRYGPPPAIPGFTSEATYYAPPYSRYSRVPSHAHGDFVIPPVVPEPVYDSPPQNSSSDWRPLNRPSETTPWSESNEPLQRSMRGEGTPRSAYTESESYMSPPPRTGNNNTSYPRAAQRPPASATRIPTSIEEEEEEEEPSITPPPRTENNNTPHPWAVRRLHESASRVAPDSAERLPSRSTVPPFVPTDKLGVVGHDVASEAAKESESVKLYDGTWAKAGDKVAALVYSRWQRRKIITEGTFTADANLVEDFEVLFTLLSARLFNAHQMSQTKKTELKYDVQIRDPDSGRLQWIKLTPNELANHQVFKDALAKTHEMYNRQRYMSTGNRY
ncbi:hypothetical protein CVT26_005951 [Gymnopilus dilepis]|uniref:Uncharacterized protein n=1 Tax=Gymnopilus dilepis TaxID=231916 RepID=A0A409WFJ2_9AGAR|nr:hypothetical protein CVT26_005951 [Gymnopilus dilepis]